MLNSLTAAAPAKGNFKIVLLKALRHLVAQLSFRDPALLDFNQELRLIWDNAVQPLFEYTEKILTTKVFPGAGAVNLNKKVSTSHWDHLIESSFHQHLLLLAIQIIKVSEETFFQDALLRLMHWLCLPQMLENKRTFELACRLLMEISTPELYKVQEFLHWQPKILNHVYFLQDPDREFLTPLVSHTDLQVFNQMPHRSPGLLNPAEESVGGPSYAKFRVSFRQTFRKVFDSKLLEATSSGKGPAPAKHIKLLHAQYLGLMALYDIEFFAQTAIPELLLNVDSDTELGLELLLLGLREAAKVLDPAQNFRQRYMTVHEQVAEVFQGPGYASAQGSLLEQALRGLTNLVESALILMV
jgi:hypothetical protein